MIPWFVILIDIFCLLSNIYLISFNRRAYYRNTAYYERWHDSRFLRARRWNIALIVLACFSLTFAVWSLWTLAHLL